MYSLNIKYRGGAPVGHVAYGNITKAGRAKHTVDPPGRRSANAQVIQLRNRQTFLWI